jgi:hypothetical protein
MVGNLSSTMRLDLKFTRPATCVRCQELQVKCEFKTETDRCQRCSNGGHDCVTRVRAPTGADAREDPRRSLASPTPILRYKCQKRALLIGVMNCKTESYPELKAAHEDVYKMRDLLIDMCVPVLSPLLRFAYCHIRPPDMATHSLT